MSENLHFKFVTDYLKNRIIKDKLDKDVSHTSLPDLENKIHAGKYKINPEEKEFFLKLYTKWIFKFEEQLHLTEKHHPEKCPVLIDLDFRYINDESNQRLYSSEDIKYFIQKYFEVLEKYIKITDEQKETFIMEKSTPVVDSKNNLIMKDGVHIIMPHIVSNYPILHLIRNDIINDKELEQKFKDLGFTNPIKDIVDEAVIERNNWFMYGSCKPNKEPYLVTKIIDYIDNEYKITEGKKNYKNSKLVTLLSINNELNIDESKISKTEINKKYEKVFGKQKKQKPRINKKFVKKTNENMDLIQQMVGILKPERANNHDTWIRLGWCLHNIDFNLLESWIDFSMQSSKFIDGECERLWYEMENEGGLEIGTLFRWAKIDNETEYKRIMQGDIESLIRKSLNKCHYDIAKVVHRLFKHEFKCVSNKSRIWYRYYNHRWHEMDNGVELKRKISEEVVDEYCNYAGKCNEIIQSMQDDTQKETFISRGKAAFEISSKLRDNTFRKHILDCCSDLFYESKFFEKLDSNVNLIGFENGVYDLEKREFREGYPDDFISFSTKIEYEEFEEDEEIVRDVDAFISQVLPQPAVKEYILKVMGSLLSGKTGQEKFHIWTGCGGNGKSKLIELFEKGFGEYCGKMSVTLITQKRAASNSCNPELVSNKGKRFVTLQEPDDDEKIHVGAMKELTGGDTIQARPLYKEPIEFKPQWKIVMTSNILPEVTAVDRGTWRRIIVTEYPSRFVEPKDIGGDLEKAAKEFKFPIDYDLSTKLEKWTEVFMWILIEKYYDHLKEIEEHGSLIVPEEVLINTEEYRLKSDLYLQFIGDNIKESPGDQLSIEEIYSVFQAWYRNSGQFNNRKNGPNKKELENNIINSFGPKKGKYWKGITIEDTSGMESDDD